MTQLQETKERLAVLEKLLLDQDSARMLAAVARAKATKVQA